MSSQTPRVEREGGTVVVFLDRPDKRNAAAVHRHRLGGGRERARAFVDRRASDGR